MLILNKQERDNRLGAFLKGHLQSWEEGGYQYKNFVDKEGGGRCSDAVVRTS